MSRQRGSATQKHSGQFTYPIISARSVRSSTRYFFKRSFMIGISRKERRARALSENFGGIEEPFRREVLNKFLSIIEWQHKRSQQKSKYEIITARTRRGTNVDKTKRRNDQGILLAQLSLMKEDVFVFLFNYELTLTNNQTLCALRNSGSSLAEWSALLAH